MIIADRFLMPDIPAPSKRLAKALGGLSTKEWSVIDGRHICGYDQPSHARLARWSGVSARTIGRHLKTAENHIRSTGGMAASDELKTYRQRRLAIKGFGVK